MLFLFKHWQIILALFVALVVTGAGLYFKGLSDGAKKQRDKQATIEREAVKEGQVIERRIMRLPKNEVQKKLEEKWCRDCV